MAHQLAHANALASGVRQHGVNPVISQRGAGIMPSRYVACWGWRHGKQLRNSGHEVLVMERAYLGDRFAWTSLGWNGLNGRARFAPRDDPERFDQHFRHLLKPWKAEGEGAYVLLIGQVPGDASLGGMDLTTWYRNSAEQAKAAYGLPVVFRPHPQAVKMQIAKAVRGTKTNAGTLADAMAGAAVVLTFNSNTAVESVLAGVPTVAADMGSMAYAMCGHKIGERVTPDREQWAARLAWCQWTMDEIKSGDAWSGICPQ